MPNRVTFTFTASDRYTAVARRMAKATQRVRVNMKLAARQAKKLGVETTKLGKKMKSTSLVAGAAAVSTLKTFGDLEQGVANVLTLLDDSAAVARFRGRIQGAAQDAVTLGFSVQDSTKALFDTVSALGANDAAFKAFEVSQRLAKAGVTDLSVAVDGVTSLMNAYGAETTSAELVANAFFTAQKKGKTTVALLASNIGKVAPIAKTAGIGLEELLATTAQLTLGGLSTEEATTALRQAIAALLKPGKDAEKVLKAMGVPVGATQIRAAGLGATLSKLAVVSERYPDLLSQAIPNIRAFTAAASLQEAELANIQAIVRQVNVDMKEGTGLTAAYNLQMGTFNENMAQALGEVKLLASTIGEGLAPVVKVLGVVIGAVARGIRALGPVASKIIGFFLGVTAIAAPVLIFLGKFGVVLAAIGTAIAGVLASPIALIGILVAAFLAVVSMVLVKFDAIKEGFSSLKDKALGLIGFGDAAEVKGTGELTSRAKAEVDLNIAAPRGVVESVKARTSGDRGGLDLGVALAEAL